VGGSSASAICVLDKSAAEQMELKRGRPFQFDGRSWWPCHFVRPSSVHCSDLESNPVPHKTSYEKQHWIISYVMYN